ncbi:MAG: phosphoribosylglycinamide formyltransferase [Anaerolineae bacterium]|nr:phosphoribosylglycinamide formyltransferase [Phycisphaerae bacterium]
MSASRSINLAVLISGSGSTLQNLIDHIAARTLNAQIVTVIASRPDLPGIQRAIDAKLPYTIVDRRSFADVSTFSAKVFELIDSSGADLICCAGWLCLLDIPARYENKIMNIHPALLPSFGGKGMYGDRVHRAVIDAGCKLSGCTVHFVDATYDTGPIILQRTCPVLDDDTPQTLAHRVFDEERQAYPHAIRLFTEGRLVVDGRRVRVK